MTRLAGGIAALMMLLPASAGAHEFSFSRIFHPNYIDVAPVNSQAPTIQAASSRYVGTAVTATPGIWTSGVPAKAWVSCTSALSTGSCTPIANAATLAYTPVAGDVGKYLRFRETVTWSGGSVQGFSAAAGPILAIPSNTGLPVIAAASVRLTGTAMSYTAGKWSSGTPTRTWVRCTSQTLANTCADIAGATLATYTPGTLDVGKFIRVRETVTYGASSVTALSAAAGPVVAVPVNTTAPRITTAASRPFGAAIAATAGVWSTGTPARAWVRCTNSTSTAACTPISGSTGTSFTPLVGDVGKFIRVRETVTYAGSLTAISFSAAVGPITWPMPENTSLPTVASSDGIQVVGTTFTATAGVWKSGTPAKAWVACTSALLTSTCTPINGATASTFKATATQVGKFIRRRETVTNPTGTKVVFSAASGPVMALPSRSTKYPQGFIGTNMDPMDLANQIGQNDVKSELRLAVEAGVERIRFPVYWSAIQPYEPRAGKPIFYDWARLDWIVSRAAELGVTLMPTLIGAPDWASRTAPANVPMVVNVPSSDHFADFAAFAKAAAARYGKTTSPFWTAWKKVASHRSLSVIPIKTWQIWNEPDHAKFWTAQYNEPTVSSPSISCTSSVTKVPTPPAGTTIANLATTYKTTGLTTTDKASKCYNATTKKLTVGWTMKLRASTNTLPCTSTWATAPLPPYAGAVVTPSYKLNPTSSEKTSRCYVSSGNRLITGWTTTVAWYVDYARMLRQARAGIVSSDPTASVMLSSFTSAGATSALFLYAGIEAIRKADSRAGGPSNYFNLVGINVFPPSDHSFVRGYNYKFELPNDPYSYPFKIQSFLSAVAAQDKGRTVGAYLTEFGWQSGRCESWLTGSMLSRCNSDRMSPATTGIFSGSWVTRDDQATLAEASLKHVGDPAKNNRVRGVLWFTWMTSDSGKKSVWEYSGLRCFGCDAYAKSGSKITRTDYRTYTKPAYAAFKRAALTFQGCYVLRGMTRQYTTKPVASRCAQ